MLHRSMVFAVLFLPIQAFAQSAGLSNLARITTVRENAKDSPDNVAAVPSSGIEVSKTAFVSGENVCGVIRIKNSSRQSATVTAIADSLEVHFPSFVSPPPGLMPG